MGLIENFTGKNKIINIDTSLIVKNPNQPRKIFDESALFELAESIKECGIIQPLTVRKLSDNYELVAGERRLRAAKLLGLKSVPVIAVNIDDNTSALIALIENLQRQDLSFFEEAISYDKLIREFSYTQEELAGKLGKKQSTIANKLRLLRLSDDIKARAVEYNLSERHCRALLKIDNEEMRVKILNLIVSKNMNVLDTEIYIDSLSYQKTKQVKKDKRIIPLFKDIRIFTNTVKQAVEIMKKAGVPADSKKNETDDYIEYVIRIDKQNGAASQTMPLS